LFLLFSAFAYANENAVVVAIEEQTPRINPLYDEDHDPTLSLVFSGLTSHDENSHVVPELAKSWQVSDDGLEYVFELRDDAFWHDGLSALRVFHIHHARRHEAVQKPQHSHRRQRASYAHHGEGY